MPPPADNTKTPLEALTVLMPDLFSGEELRRWLRLNAPEDVLIELPGDSAPVAEVIDKALGALNRRGLIDAAFFDGLKRIRERKRRAIELVEAKWIIRTSPTLLAAEYDGVADVLRPSPAPNLVDEAVGGTGSGGSLHRERPASLERSRAPGRISIATAMTATVSTPPFAAPPMRFGHRERLAASKGTVNLLPILLTLSRSDEAVLRDYQEDILSALPRDPHSPLVLLSLRYDLADPGACFLAAKPCRGPMEGLAIEFSPWKRRYPPVRVTLDAAAGGAGRIAVYALFPARSPHRVPLKVLIEFLAD